MSVLAHDQDDVCRQLATPGANKFRAITWASSPRGHPIIAGCVAWFDCDIERTETIGDHRLVVTTVRSLAAQRGAPVHGVPPRFVRGLTHAVA